MCKQHLPVVAVQGGASMNNFKSFESLVTKSYTINMSIREMIRELERRNNKVLIQCVFFEFSPFFSYKSFCPEQIQYIAQR